MPAVIPSLSHTYKPTLSTVYTSKTVVQNMNVSLVSDSHPGNKDGEGTLDRQDERQH